MDFLKAILARRPHLIPAAVAIGMLVVAHGHWPYAYYEALRWVVCIAAAGVLWALYFGNAGETYGGPGLKVVTWGAMLAVGVLFNPLIPIYATRDFWQVADLCAAGVFTAVALIVARNKGTTKGEYVLLLLFLGVLWGAGLWVAALGNYPETHRTRHATSFRVPRYSDPFRTPRRDRW
jgi:FtsH-binding integral membrane protein